MCASLSQVARSSFELHLENIGSTRTSIQAFGFLEYHDQHLGSFRDGKWFKNSNIGAWATGFSSCIQCLPMLDVNQKFLFKLNSSNWDRFLYYAERVREMRFEHYDGMLDCSTFVEFARSRPVLTPFWRLQRLHVVPSQYSIGMHHIVLFLHDGLEELDIPATFSQQKDLGFLSNQCIVCDLLNDVVHRATGLRRLRLHIHAHGRHLQDDLIGTIPKLRRLTELELLPCLVTPTLVLALSQLPELSVFSVDSHQCSRAAGAPILCDVIDLPFPDAQDVVFPSLEVITLQGQLAHITPLFSGSGSFTCLTTLAIDMMLESTGSRIRTLLERVAKVCPSIQSIELSRLRDVGSHTVQSKVTDPITIHSIRPVSSMKNLCELFISSPSPVQITDEGLLSLLAEQCTLDKLDSLELGAEPTHFIPPAMTLRVLIDLAKYRPGWKFLRLYLQTHMVRECLVLLDKADEHIEFGELVQLEIAFSPIQQAHIDDLAIFLSKLIPPTCAFFTDDYLGVGDTDPNHTYVSEIPFHVVTDIRARKAKWKIVKQKLNVLHRARTGDRRRLMEMERRVKELEMRKA
jgi:hypothetical protein